MNGSRRQPELDSLRGIAVLLVVFDHFGISRVWNGFPWGIIGVKLLFLFSGYFATREFLKYQEPTTGQAVNLVLGRLCRVLPVGAAILILGWLLGVEGAETGVPLHLLVAGNLQILRTGEWLGAFSHLWSLALQIQFYLLWPLLLISVRPRHWSALCFVCFALAWAYRTGCLASGAPDLLRWMHLPGSVDAFAAGALVGIIESNRPACVEWVRQHRGAVAGTTCLLLALGCGLRLGGFPAPLQALMETFECAFAFGLLALLRSGALPFARLLRIPPLPWIGLISFGLYGFHPVIENHLRRQDWARHLDPVPWLFEAMLLALSLLAGFVCLVLVERPSSKLRRRVNSWTAGGWLGTRFSPFPLRGCLAAAAVFLVLPVVIGQAPLETAATSTIVDSGEGESGDHSPDAGEAPGDPGTDFPDVLPHPELDPTTDDPVEAWGGHA